MADFDKKWSKKNHERWKATRAKGKKHFVIFKGVLTFGLAMFAIMTIVPAVMRQGDENYNLMVNMLVGIVLWPLAGAWWGSFVWNLSEKKFLEHEKKN